MAQINLHVTPEFEEALDALITGRGLASKSEAIRLAVREAAAPYQVPPRRDLGLLEGLLRNAAGRQRTPMARIEAEIDAEMQRALEVPARGKTSPPRRRR